MPLDLTLPLTDILQNLHACILRSRLSGADEAECKASIRQVLEAAEGMDVQRHLNGVERAYSILGGYHADAVVTSADVESAADAITSAIAAINLYEKKKLGELRRSGKRGLKDFKLFLRPEGGSETVGRPRMK